MGDYTWTFFRRADTQYSGAFRTLDAKAVRLSGMPAEGGRSAYLAAFQENRVDAYVMYRTNASMVQQRLPELEIVTIPTDLNVRAAYGVAALPDSPPGQRLMERILGAQGQEILRRHGFSGWAQ